MTSVSLYARKLANALDELEYIRSWVKDYPDTKVTQAEVTVSWQTASGCVGYRELSRRVGSIVGKSIREHIQQAVCDAEVEVRKCYRDLEDAAMRAGKGLLKAGETDAN